MRTIRLVSAYTFLFLALYTSATAEDNGHMIRSTGITGGLASFVECASHQLPLTLSAKDSFLVHLLFTSQKRVDEARTAIEAQGARKKASANRWSPPALPYADCMVNLLVVGKKGLIEQDEINRVLAPLGTVLVYDGKKWSKRQKPWPEEMDQWTHYLYDASGNAVSKDKTVAPPLRHLRWRCGPRWCRSHETDMSLSTLVSAGGKIFSIQDEGPRGIYDTRGSGGYRFSSKWSLAARDAFNGIQLWKISMEKWGSAAWDDNRWVFDRFNQLWSAPYTLPRLLVAAGDRVYVTLSYGGCVSEIDADTGETLRKFKETDHAEEIIHHRGVLVVRLRSIPAGEEKRDAICALDTASGKVLWKKTFAESAALTLASRDDFVCFQADRQLHAVDLLSGKVKWRCKVQKKRSGSLLIHDKCILLAAQGTVKAFSVDNGSLLWNHPARNSFRGPPDVMVSQNTVWLGNSFQGYDPATGEISTTRNPGHLFTGGHHFRCYRCKATEDFILFSKRGIEFMDLTSDRHARHDWVRGTCRYGFMPANGLVYAPPDPCFCYPGVKLDGFNALAGGPTDTSVPKDTPPEDRLEKGPAYQAFQTSPKDAETPVPTETQLAWPLYRHDAARSGATDMHVSVKLTQAWKIEFEDALTPAVAAGDKLLVSQPSVRKVHCIDAEDGRRIWSYTAGGAVDSPPAVCRAGKELLCIFGCCDGKVYCLKLSDGQCIWKFSAAPRDRRIVSFGRLESSWPVRGSVLIQNGTVYCAAGRSSYLDSGIHLYGLDAATGEVRYHRRLSGPEPDLTKPNNRPHEMDGAKNDIFVSDGETLFLTQNLFDTALKPLPSPTIAKHGARRTPLHLMATGGFLNNTWFDRTYWLHAKRWPGQYVAVNASKAGQILVFDENTTYGLHVFTQKFSRSPRFVPGEGYTLFADDNANEPYLTKKQAARERGIMTRSEPAKWSRTVKVRARAMVLAGNSLFFAGPPDHVEDKNPFATFEGKSDAKLHAVSAADGRTLATYHLEAPPVFDGMIAAYKRLYICMENGALVCMEGKQINAEQKQ